MTKNDIERMGCGARHRVRRVRDGVAECVECGQRAAYRSLHGEPCSDLWGVFAEA